MIHSPCSRKEDEYRTQNIPKRADIKITTKGITEEGEKEKYKEIKDFLVDSEKVRMI